MEALGATIKKHSGFWNSSPELKAEQGARIYLLTMEDNDEGGKLKQEEEEEENQEIWSWGAGTDGQLGTGKLQDEHFPQLLRLPALSSAGPTSFSLLSCGGAHVLALTAGPPTAPSSYISLIF